MAAATRGQPGTTEALLGLRQQRVGTAQLSGSGFINWLRVQATQCGSVRVCLCVCERVSVRACVRVCVKRASGGEGCCSQTC